MTSIVEEENEESGEHTVNFTVMAAYQAVGYEPEEETAEDAGEVENGAAEDAAVTDEADTVE